MGALLTITGKDLRQRLRDRSAFIFGIVAPLVLAGIFSLVLGGIDDGPTDVRWLVVDEDGGPLGAELATVVLPAVADDLDGVVEARTDRAAALAEVEAGDADAVLIVPAGLSAAAGPPSPPGGDGPGPGGDGPGGAGDGVEIEVVGRSGAALSQLVLDAVAGSYAEQVARAQANAATVAMLGRPDLIEQVIAATTEAALELRAESTTGQVLDLRSGMSAGMAVFFLLFTVQFGIVSLLEERKAGTLLRLYAAPIGRGVVLASKALTALVLGLVSMAVLAVASSLLLGANWGSPLPVAALILAAVLAATGLMAAIGAVARTAEQANNASAAAAIVLGMLGGTFFPVGGTVLERLQLITPHAWFLRGLSEVSAGAAFPTGPIVALTVLGLVGAVVATLLLRREVRG